MLPSISNISSVPAPLAPSVTVSRIAGKFDFQSQQQRLTKYRVNKLELMRIWNYSNTLNGTYIPRFIWYVNPVWQPSCQVSTWQTSCIVPCSCHVTVSCHIAMEISPAPTLREFPAAVSLNVVKLDGQVSMGNGLDGLNERGKPVIDSGTIGYVDSGVWELCLTLRNHAW